MAVGLAVVANTIAGAIRYHYPEGGKNLDPGLSSLLLSGGTLDDVFIRGYLWLTDVTHHQYTVLHRDHGPSQTRRHLACPTRDQSRIPGNGIPRC
jgi:hypothetical protein